MALSTLDRAGADAGRAAVLRTVRGRPATLGTRKSRLVRGDGPLRFLMAKRVRFAAMSDPKAPGWYPDPIEPGVQRWWDGDRWAEIVRPAEAAADDPVDELDEGEPTEDAGGKGDDGDGDD